MNNSSQPPNQVLKKTNQNIQVYARIRPLNHRERCIRSTEIIEMLSPKEILARHTLDSKLTKKFTFDRVFGQESKQVEVYKAVVDPLIQEVLAGYNCTVFAYGQTGTGKTHTMIGNECAQLKCSWDDDSDIGMIPRALCHLFDELRLADLEFTMRISYLELYNEELCDLLSSDDNTKIRIYDDSTKKGSVIIQGLEEVPVYSKEDVYKLLEKGKERRKTATTLMNAQSSRSHTVFSIVVHIRDNGIDNEELLKIGKLNLVDLAGSENINKSGNEKGIRARETVNINQSLLTLGRVITALVERTPHIPYRESKLTRLLQESLGGRTKTSIIATISPGHKDIEETLSTLEYAHRAKNIQNKPEVNQKLTKKSVLKEYVEKIDKLTRDLIAARDKNGIYLAEETYGEMILQMDSLKRELNEKTLFIKELKDELQNKENLLNDISLRLVQKTALVVKFEKKYTGMRKKQKRTRQRYLEKKLVLQSQKKTEEILTKQATEIMKAADTATSDAEALHATIDRHKDVEIRLQTACEHLTERMQNNFQQLNENLSSFERQYISFTNNIQDELSQSSELHLQQVNEVENKIHEISAMQENYMQCTKDIMEKFTENLLAKHHNDNKETMSFLEHLLSIQAQFAHDLEIRLNDIKDDHNKQANTTKQMHDYIQEALKQHLNRMNTHNEETHELLVKIETCALNNCNALEKVQENIDKQCALMVEEERMLKQRMENMRTISSHVVDFEANCYQVLEELNKKRDLDVKHLSEYKKFIQEESQKVEEFKEHIEIINEANEKHINDCVEKAQNKIMKQELEKFSVNRNTVMNDINSLVEDYEHNTKRIRLDHQRKFSTTINDDLKKIINDNSRHFKNRLTVAHSLNDTFCNAVNNFDEHYKDYMSKCVNDVVAFKCNELKACTYTATGRTPAKRTFVYPNVLTQSSPDNRIIERFRLEKDWSELDTTLAATEEESTFLSDAEVSSVDHDQLELNGATKNLLNSTPLKISNQRASTSPSSISVKSSNTSKSGILKESTKCNNENHSMNSESKCTLKNSFSPDHNNCNKENVSSNN